MSQSPQTPTDTSSAKAIDGQPALVARYWSCSHEELIELQIVAWGLGGDGAKADGDGVLRDLMAIEQRAERACEEALRIYVPLDLARFRDIFTLAWVGGYCATRGPAVGYGAS